MITHVNLPPQKNSADLKDQKWTTFNFSLTIKKRGVASDATFLALTRQSKSPLAGKSPLVGSLRYGLRYGLSVAINFARVVLSVTLRSRRLTLQVSTSYLAYDDYDD